MFSVAEVIVDSKEKPWKNTGNSSFELSIKTTETFRIARMYADRGEEFTFTLTKPKVIEEEYEVIYMSSYDSLLVGSPRKFWNPFGRNQQNSVVE